MQDCLAMKNNLSHFQNFEELPDGTDVTRAGFDDFIAEAGQCASLVSEGLAGVKGQKWHPILRHPYDCWLLGASSWGECGNTITQHLKLSGSIA